MPQPRFYNATEKLINAFLMGTITHGAPCSCAVGTMCGNSYEWMDARFVQDNYIKAMGIISKIKYSAVEIFEIEKNFEWRDKSALNSGWGSHALNNHNDPDGFIGLCRVFDYLASIEVVRFH